MWPSLEDHPNHVYLVFVAYSPDFVRINQISPRCWTNNTCGDPFVWLALMPKNDSKDGDWWIAESPGLECHNARFLNKEHRFPEAWIKTTGRCQNCIHHVWEVVEWQTSRVATLLFKNMFNVVVPITCGNRQSACSNLMTEIVDDTEMNYHPTFIVCIYIYTYVCIYTYIYINIFK